MITLRNDENDDLWLASPDGLGKLDNGQWSTLYVNNEIEDILKVWSVNNSIWVGTGYSGLMKYNGNSWELIPTPELAEILDIDIDDNDRLWLGPDHGIIMNKELRLKRRFAGKKIS